jgi:pyrroloquinoline quinone biosynthesis protein E
MPDPGPLPEASPASSSGALLDQFLRVPESIRLEARGEYCLVVDPRRGVFDVLHPMEALLLSLLDGQTAISTLAEMVGTIYRLPPGRADALTTTALAKVRPFLEASATPTAGRRRFDPKAYLVPGYQEPPGRGRPFATPLAAILVPTWQCNFRCRYCYFGTDPQPATKLDRATALRVIREAADLGVVTLHLGGGEPLLYPHLAALVAAATERGLLVSFSTNGSRLTEKKIQALRAAGLVSVQVSLDTALPAVHDALTQAPGTFPRVVAALRHLKAAGLYVRVRAVLTPETLTTVPELLDLLAILAVDEVELGPVKCGSCEVAGAPAGNRLDPQALAALRRLVADRRGQFPAGRLRLADAETPWRSPAELIYCGNLTVSLVVHPTGRVSACEMIRYTPELCYGDIHDASLRDIWLGPRHRALLAAATDSARIDPACARCPSLRYCRTGCMNRSRLATGSFWGKDPRCPGPEAMSPPEAGERGFPG